MNDSSTINLWKQEELLSVSEVARLLHVSTRSVYRFIEKGRLTAIILSTRKTCIFATSVEHLLLECGYKRQIGGTNEH